MLTAAAGGPSTTGEWTRRSAPGSGLPARALLTHSARLWPRVTGHPRMREVGGGNLSDAEFRRWMVNDHYFNVEYQRFIAGLAGIAPADAATETIGTALSDTRLGLTTIRRLSERFAVDLGGEPELLFLDGLHSGAGW